MRSRLIAVCAVALAGCGQPAPNDKVTPDTNQATEAPPPANVVDAAAPTIPAPPIPAPTSPEPSIPNTPRSPPEPKGPINPKSAEAAGQVVQLYGALLEERRFAEARALWGDEGKASGLSAADFAAAYAKYAAIHAEVGAPGATEGAAGSIYVDVPLRLYGTLKRGGAFNLVGPVSLRRVNDVEGAAPQQLRWHIAQSGLKPRP